MTSTKSELVLVREDPDAPMGRFVHWLLADIPESTGLHTGFTAEDVAEVRERALASATLVGTYGR